MKGAYDLGRTVERFTCSPGRYTSRTDDGDTLELETDHGRVRRLVAAFDGWAVRGGVVGDEVRWVRGEEEHRAVAQGFTGASPAFDVVTAELVALAPGETRTVTLVELTLPVGAALTVRHGWARLADPDPGVERYQVDDLATGERWTVSLADGVVISREGRHPAVLAGLTR